MIKLLGKANSKLQKTEEYFNVKIFNFSIPAGNDKKTGKLICAFAKECLKLCYAKKGNYRFTSVEKGMSYRYELSKQENFIELIDKAIKKVKTDKQYIFGYMIQGISIPLVTLQNGYKLRV